MISGLILLPFCGPLSTLYKTVRKDLVTFFWVSFFQTFLLYGFFYVGMTLVPSALAAIIIGSSPLFAAVTAHIFLPTERITVSKMISIGIGISGIVLISVSRQAIGETGFREGIGIFILIIGTISSALGNIIVQKKKDVIKPVLLNSVQIFIGGFLLLLLSFFVEGKPSMSYPASFYIALAWLSFLSAAAFSIWFTLLQKPDVTVTDLNFWKFIIPVCGAGLSWILLPDENPSTISIAGMILVTAAIIFFYRKGEKNRVSHST